jgi:hypothetical protein
MRIDNITTRPGDVGLIPSSSMLTGIATSASYSVTASYLGGTLPTLVHAQNTSGLTVADNSTVTVTGWTNLLAQNAAEWNATSGVFTATKAGTYSVSTTVTYAAAAAATFGSQVYTSIRRSGVIQSAASIYSETGNSILRGSPSTTAIVSLGVGDTITIQTYQNLGSTVALSTGAGLTTVSIQEIASRITD